MANSNVTVELIDSDNNLVGKYVVSRMNIAANVRRIKMNSEIIESDHDDAVKNNLFACAALACSLQDTKGNFLYPDDDGYKVIFETMDPEVYDELCGIYPEVNPVGSSLVAKKKKS